jgi:IS30 family transposase
MSPLTPARRPWTADERKKLDDLTKAGKIAAEIATALHRTPNSIYSQLQRLDIKRRKAHPPPGRARAEGEGEMTGG